MFGFIVELNSQIPIGTSHERVTKLLSLTRTENPLLLIFFFLFNFFVLTEWEPNSLACASPALNTIFLSLPSVPPGLNLRLYHGRRGNRTLVWEEPGPMDGGATWEAHYTPRPGHNRLVFRLKYFDPATNLTSARYSRPVVLSFWPAKVPRTQKWVGCTVTP